jgi:hypothetical protein
LREDAEQWSYRRQMNRKCGRACGERCHQRQSHIIEARTMDILNRRIYKSSREESSILLCSVTCCRLFAMNPPHLSKSTSAASFSFLVCTNRIALRPSLSGKGHCTMRSNLPERSRAGSRSSNLTGGGSGVDFKGSQFKCSMQCISLIQSYHSEAEYETLRKSSEKCRMGAV